MYFKDLYTVLNLAGRNHGIMRRINVMHVDGLWKVLIIGAYVMN